MIIGLTKDKKAIIDDEDLDKIAPYKWGYGFGGMGGEYAKSRAKDGSTIRMHRLLMNAQRGEEVDHVNGNGLDNRRSNLRIVNRNQNNMNKKHYKSSKHKYKGIKPSGKRWAAYIYLNGKYYHIGSFPTQEEAALAYNTKAIELFGEHARLNVIAT